MLTERGGIADGLSVFLVLFNGGGGWKTREVTFAVCGGSIHVFSSNLWKGERERESGGGGRGEVGRETGRVGEGRMKTSKSNA